MDTQIDTTSAEATHATPVPARARDARTRCRAETLAAQLGCPAGTRLAVGSARDAGDDDAATGAANRGFAGGARIEGLPRKTKENLPLRLQLRRAALSKGKRTKIWK
jgi:hypothetical protein